MATIRQRQSTQAAAPANPTAAAPAAPAAQAPHGRRGGAPAMMARASAQAGDGAGALFARLNAADASGETGDGARAVAAPDRRRAEAERLLARWAARIHAGEWSDGIGELVLMAQTLERAYPPNAPSHRL